MSLIIFRNKSEIPDTIDYINSNDLFFNEKTTIPDTPLAKEILKKVDKADYYSELVFTSRTKDLGNLFKNYLSSGTKTLLNIISNPDKCFNLAECGINVLDFIPKIKDGIVLWEHISLFPEDEDESCDIVYKDKQFTNIYEFLNYARYEDED
ncbi:MAG: DUF4869 domain-containing protein [Lachnospiraceae bacterium]|nr:DUF4869 domain-containing protein [Lachnospiraceae bacterium]